jgi:hypothetical protein
MSIITDIVAGVFKPITEVVEHITVSGDEKYKLQSALIEGQMALAKATTDYESQLLESHTKIILAEAQSSSWLASNWRPISMIVFLALVVFDAFGWLPFRLADQAWTLLQVGIGGYTIGRSVEKVGPAIVAAVKAAK